MSNQLHKALKITAVAVSDVFSPLLMATYAMIVALWLTPMRLLPTDVRAWSTVGVFLITGVIPAALVALLMRMGHVSDASISDRRQRAVPFAFTVFCYLGAAFFIGALHAPAWMVRFLGGAAVVAAVELFVSFAWKISAHTAGVGGLAALVFWLANRGALVADGMTLISVAVMLTGIVAWARLFLHRHTVLQTLAGACLGFGVILGALAL